MSTYIVDDKTLNIILLAVIGCNCPKLSRYGEFAGENFLHEERFEVVHEVATRIGQKLLNMNYDAVNQRYRRDDKPHTFVFQYRLTTHARNVYAAIKELIYQCYEGNVPEKNPLFAELEALKASVAIQIVDQQVSW